MRIKNLGGTSSNFPKPTCKCISWLDHWDKNKYTNNNKIAGYCRGCGKKFDHKELNGAHVIKINSLDGGYYIVPLCDSCHGKVNQIYDVEEMDLVSANCTKCQNG